jgi:hypothetical protein
VRTAANGVAFFQTRLMRPSLPVRYVRNLKLKGSEGELPLSLKLLEEPR